MTVSYLCIVRDIDVKADRIVKHCADIQRVHQTHVLDANLAAGLVLHDNEGCREEQQKSMADLVVVSHIELP